jgi:hypothetical protein
MEGQAHDQLEELDVPKSAPMGPPPGPPPAPPRSYPQLYRFFIGALMVAIGTLLPFGSVITTSMVPPKTLEIGSGAPPSDLGQSVAEAMRGEGRVVTEAGTRTLPATTGADTFSGALFLLLAILVMWQMWVCIQKRRVGFSPLLLFFPAGWSWMKLIAVKDSIPDFAFGDIYKLATLEQLALHVGSGFLMVWIGATFAAINFVFALIGAFTSGGKKDESAPARGARRR